MAKRLREEMKIRNQSGHMNYSNQLREFVAANFLFGDAAGLKDDASFLDTGIIDSTGILELITFLEDTYLIKIEAAEMVPENLDSISKVCDFLGRKLQRSPKSVAPNLAGSKKVP